MFKKLNTIKPELSDSEVLDERSSSLLDKTNLIMTNNGYIRRMAILISLLPLSFLLLIWIWLHVLWCSYSVHLHT